MNFNLLILRVEIHFNAEALSPAEFRREDEEQNYRIDEMNRACYQPQRSSAKSLRLCVKTQPQN
jgi:hypothetical protein